MIVGVAILAERLSLTARWTMDESRRCPLLLPLFFFFFLFAEDSVQSFYAVVRAQAHSSIYPSIQPYLFPWSR